MTAFKNKTALITGASSGIGKALAAELLKQGARVIIASHNEAELKETEAELNNPNCHIKVFDLSIQEEVEKAADELLEKYSVIDVLINNGGISQRSLIKDTSIDIDRKIMEIDYFSYVILTKKLLPVMLKNDGGYIAATSSISGLFGFPLRSAYAAAKHAIQGFFETLRAEHLNDNIKVTIAYPGRVKTNISLHALKKDGKPHGKMDAGQAGGVSPE